MPSSSMHSKDMFSSVKSSSQEMQRPKPSQGSGKSIPSQASKTSNSQVSSVFKLLASEEVTSQVITCHGHGEVVKQSLASQQELGEDLAVWCIVPTEEVLDNEVDAVEDFTDVEPDANTLEADSDSLPQQPTAKQSTSCLLYTSPSPRDRTRSRMPSSA